MSSNLISFVSYRRPDQPQPVYPRVVDAIVAKWAPAFNSELNCFRTGSRATLESRHLETPQFDWLARPVIDPIVRTWSPVFNHELNQLRTGQRPVLENRHLETPEFDWTKQVVDPIIARWIPSFDEELSSFRTSNGPQLNVSTSDTWAPEFTWPLRAVNPIVASWSPAFSSELDDTMTRSVASINVRDWMALTAWIFTNLPTGSTVAQQWPALLQAMGISYRSASGPILDVRSSVNVPAFSWEQPVVDGIVRLWTPNWTDGRTGGERTPERAKLNPRDSDWSPEFGWATKQVDSVVSTWSTVWADHGNRTTQRSVFDIRSDTSPSLAWIFTNIPATLTTAQIWPAILQALGISYRSLTRSGFDVNMPWQPEFTAPNLPVDAIVAKWIPIFDAEVGVRTPSRSVLDVRGHEWAGELAWIYKAADAVFASWVPVFEQNGKLNRPPARQTLDVRGHDWSAEFTWAQRVVDAIVAKWAPIWNAEVGLWTPGRPVLEVRSITRDPQIGWWAAVIVITPPPDFVIMTSDSFSTSRMTSESFTFTIFVSDTWVGSE